MCRLRLADELETRIREPGVGRAAVFGARPALDQPAFLEGVDDPRDAAQGEPGRPGEDREA